MAVVAADCAAGRSYGASWSHYGETMRLVELDRLTEPYWEELVAGER